MKLEKLKQKLSDEIDHLNYITNENIIIIQLALIKGLQDQIRNMEVKTW